MRLLARACFQTRAGMHLPYLHVVHLVFGHRRHPLRYSERRRLNMPFSAKKRLPTKILKSVFEHGAIEIVRVREPTFGSFLCGRHGLKTNLKNASVLRKKMGLTRRRVISHRPAPRRRRRGAAAKTARLDYPGKFQITLVRVFYYRKMILMRSRRPPGDPWVSLV